MWTAFKSLFFSKTPNGKDNLPHDFDRLVRHAISLIKKSKDVDTNEQLLFTLTNNGIDHKAAVEIILFLPTAFIRQWIPSAKWSDTYIEFTDGKNQITRSYSKTKSYQIIWNVTTEYFANNPDPDTIFRIGGRSAEFNLINPLLNANPALKVEDINLSDLGIIR
jgi:hypothetical protein